MKNRSNMLYGKLVLTRQRPRKCTETTDKLNHYCTMETADNLSVQLQVRNSIGISASSSIFRGPRFHGPSGFLMSEYPLAIHNICSRSANLAKGSRDGVYFSDSPETKEKSIALPHNKVQLWLLRLTD